MMCTASSLSCLSRNVIIIIVIFFIIIPSYHITSIYLHSASYTMAIQRSSWPSWPTYVNHSYCMWSKHFGCSLFTHQFWVNPNQVLLFCWLCGFLSELITIVCSSSLKGMSVDNGSERWNAVPNKRLVWNYQQITGCSILLLLSPSFMCYSIL